MGNSGIKSGIQFESYKLDNVSFEMIPEVSILSKKEYSKCEIKYRFAFRNALRLKKNNKTLYITGLKIDLSIFDKELDKDIANGAFVISGIFSSSGELDKDVEEKLIKCQAPTILFPYIRASITTLLSMAGFSTIILPLINVANAAESLDLKIEDIEIKEK